LFLSSFCSGSEWIWKNSAELGKEVSGLAIWKATRGESLHIRCDAQWVSPSLLRKWRIPSCRWVLSIGARNRGLIASAATGKINSLFGDCSAAGIEGSLRLYVALRLAGSANQIKSALFMRPQCI
jgi:hypothetical protein